MHRRRLKTVLELSCFLESFSSEKGSLLQILWRDKEYRLSRPTKCSLSSCLINTQYPEFGREAFIAAGVSTELFDYLSPKIVSLIHDVSTLLNKDSPPSLFMLAEISTITDCFGFEGEFQPLITRGDENVRQRPETQSSLGYRLFLNDNMKKEKMNIEKTRALSLLKKVKTEDGESCSICLDLMSSSEHRTGFPCNHFFHERCILTWMEQSRTCPDCRFKI